MPGKSLAKQKKFSGPAGLSAAGTARPPLVRMVRIHELIAGGRHPNCAQLAREFEVAGKTVQRDIDFMRDQLALPIDYDRVRHGFFYSRAVAQFPMITVSQGELVALLVAQKAVEQYRGTNFEKPLRAAFDKLVSSLGGEASVSLHELSDAVSFRSTGVPDAQIEVFELVADGVMTSCAVAFDYLSLKSAKPGRREVEPYHLAAISNQWYLIGKDVDRGGLRTFALSRISAARKLGRSFERPADFSVSRMLSGSFSAFQAARVEKVVIRFDEFATRLVGERQWHSSQKLMRLADGGGELRMRVGLAPDLEAWILGWGSHAEVIEPAALRERVAAEARAAAARYGAEERLATVERTGRSRPLHACVGTQTFPGGTTSVSSESASSAPALFDCGTASPKLLPKRCRPAHFPGIEPHNRSVIYFVTVCTKDRRPLLANAQAQRVIRNAWAAAGAYHVGRYVLMPDHVHFFCSPAEIPPRALSEWMRFWKSHAARHWDWDWDSGEIRKLWQREYWDTQLRQGASYGEKWEYVVRNPVRARLVGAPEDWPWQGEVHRLDWHD